VLLIVACEPVLSNEYDLAHDFYMALAKSTSGSMFALTNTNVLAPLIVGFALEQVAIDSLASHFRSIVINFQKKGMSEAEMASRLFTLLQTKEVKITTLKSTEVYTEPAEAAEIVSTWFNANSTPPARKEVLAREVSEIQAIERVPEAFITSGNPLTWPEHLVPITLKNLSEDFIVEYMYPERGVKKYGVLKEGQISEKPTMFRLNTPYMFTLRKGRTIISTSRTFSKLGDWDLAVYFN